MTPGVDLRVLRGAEILPHIDDVARLRIAVFRAFPYLYDGSAEYEARYLSTYAEAAESVFVLALDGEKVVGAATAMPLADETDQVRAPFEAQGSPVDRIFYFGESVLLDTYRGRGIGVGFFEKREQAARRMPGIDACVFCAVERAADHPLKPANYVPLDGFWRKRGYRPMPNMKTIFAWRDVGDESETRKPMNFWIKTFDQ